MNEQIERIMKNLKCSREEAEAILAEDKRIDRGEKVNFDLSEEEHRKAMKNANAGTRTAKEGKTARKAPENPTKEGVIAKIAEFLTENGYNSVEITNKTRQIAFKIGEDAYELTLIAKRKPKNWKNGGFFPQFFKKTLDTTHFLCYTNRAVGSDGKPHWQIQERFWY